MNENDVFRMVEAIEYIPLYLAQIVELMKAATPTDTGSFKPYMGDHP